MIDTYSNHNVPGVFFNIDKSIYLWYCQNCNENKSAYCKGLCILNIKLKKATYVDLP